MMIKKAAVVRAYLSSMPSYIQRQLINNSRIFEMAKLGSGRSQSGLSLDYRAIRMVLAELPMNEVKQVATHTAPGWFPVRRTIDGVSVGNPGEKEASIIFFELGLFDPDSDTRRRSFEVIARRALPAFPGVEEWWTRINEGPLQVEAFTKLLALLGETAEPVLAAIEALTEFGLNDLVPLSDIYYKSLVGVQSDEIDSLNLTRDWPLTHLQTALTKDVEWGWRCIRAVYTSAYFSPAEICADVESEALLAAIDTSTAVTPQALLATLEVGLFRGSGDPRFMAQAEQALVKIIAAVRAPDAIKGGDLSAALAMFTLRRISVDPRLAHMPVAWRRMASLAHADMLCHVLSLEVAQEVQIADRCWSLNSVDMVTADLWDLRLAPRWQPSLELYATPWLRALGRAILLVDALKGDAPNVAVDALNGLLVDEEIDVKKNAALLQTRAPHLLSGVRSLRATDSTEMLSEETLRISTWSCPWQPYEWQCLWVFSAQIFFDKSLIDATIQEFTSSLTQQKSIADQMAILVIAARIAAAQGNLTLSTAVTERAMSIANQLNTSELVALAFHVTVAAAAVETDTDKWVDHLSDKFLELARNVPKGRCASELAAQIVSLERFVPLEKRKWRLAVSLARAAS